MSDRYKQEIEDILQQAGEWTTSERVQKRKASIWRLAWLQVRTAATESGWAVTPGRVMLTSLVLFLAALVIHAAAPGLGLVGPLAVAGIIAFIVAYGFFLLKPRRGPGSDKRWRGRPIEHGAGMGYGEGKRWRGQRVDDSTPEASWWDKLRGK
ncbi:MAG: hypothetical protein FJ317_02945 [SAR202 cluster bacterium]|nr:hypothetical protein [SAR202 cluster bacterium]